MSRQSKWTLAIAGIVIIFSALAIQQAGLAPHFVFDHLGSGTVPYFVAVSLLVLTALMLFEEFVLNGDGSPLDKLQPRPKKREASKPRWSVGLRTGIVFASFVIFVLILDFTEIPFWLATWVFTYLASRVLEGGTGRGRLISLAIGAAVAIGVRIVFTEFLLIDLP